MVAHFGGTAEEVTAAQQGVLRNYFASVHVFGLGADGTAQDEVALTLDDNTSGEIEIDLGDGTKPAIGALCGSLTTALTYQSERMRRRGLQPVIRYRFRAELLADEARLAAARRELGTEGVDEVSWGGNTPREYLKLSPGRDKGLSLSLRRGFRSI
jgi:hypothetical protein